MMILLFCFKQFDRNQNKINENKKTRIKTSILLVVIKQTSKELNAQSYFFDTIVIWINGWVGKVFVSKKSSG